MDKLKQYVVFTVLGCLVVLAAGWFLLVSPKRSEAADLRTQAAAQVTANNQLEAQLALLKAQAKDLPKQQARLAAVAAKIPDNPALPALVRALSVAGTSAGVELLSMTPGGPTVLPAAPGAPAAVAGQLASIPVTLSVAGGYFQVEQFVANLESLPRSMRVTSLTVTPGANPLKAAAGAAAADGRGLTSSISAQVFMAANRPPATAVSVPGQPVAGTAVGPAAPVVPAKK